MAVRPCAAHRQAFARWAVTVGVRTVSSHDFDVPADRFGEIPARLLAGAEVDGQLLEQAPADTPAGEAPPAAAPVPPTTPPEPAPEPAPVVVPAGATTGHQEGPGAPQAAGGSEPAPEGTPGPDGPPAGPETPQPGPEATPHPDTDGQTTDELGADTDGEDAGGQGPLPCRWCPRTFTTAHGLRTHVGMSHRNQAPDPAPPQEAQ